MNIGDLTGGAWQIWSLNTTANRRRLDAGSPPPDPFRERYPFLTGSAGAVSELRRTAGKGEREDGEGKSHCYPVLAVESDVSERETYRVNSCLPSPETLDLSVGLRARSVP